MTPAGAARVLVAAGWLGGLAVVLAVDLALGIVVLLASLAGSLACLRWGSALAATVRALRLVRKMRGELNKKGNALEHAR